MVENEHCVLRIVNEFAPDIGGSITHIIELSQKINPYLKNQTLFAPYIKGCESFDQTFNIPIVRSKCKKTNIVGSPIIDNMFYSLCSKKEIIEIIEKNKINIVHFHSPILALYLSPIIKKYDKDIKIIVMVHGWYSQKSRKYGLSYRLLKKMINHSQSDRYIILNDGTQIRELQLLLDKKEIPWNIVYHGIDTDTFRPNKDYIKSNSFKILYPHRPISVKRPDLAIEIFQRFLQKVPNSNASLVFLGADDSEELIDIAKRKNLDNKIQFREKLYRGKLLDCINSSSVVIGTSLNSNNGRAIQEAMACEKPVVVFDNNGNMSNLIQNMENGMMVNNGNIDEFTNCLIKLYKNTRLRKEIGYHARKTIIENRSWYQRINTELEIYKYTKEIK